MGVGDDEQQSVLDSVGGNLKFLGYVGHALRSLYAKLFGKKVAPEDKEILAAFKLKVDRVLYEYIKLDLDSSENALIVTHKRSTRVRAIIEHQKRMKEQTEEDLEAERQELEKAIFIDRHNFSQDGDLKNLLYGED